MPVLITETLLVVERFKPPAISTTGRPLAGPSPLGATGRR